MELLTLVLILAIFLLPSIFMMRSQKKRQSEMMALRNSLVPGDRIVTVGGLHGKIVASRDTEVDLEVSPGVVITIDSAGIMRRAEPQTTEPQATTESYWENREARPDATDGQSHPENN
ncbi:preprotein translocase subunit YajC [Corynebacterium breve]|uniref:Preprotein translocase subunit YajC n=1 Tax=Corynebacterium breve TaxID=3049799 RepID=A0ABY8VJJ5_9CORY|nr:preprotein translocase subunit YajC [Corynebacterium breve]WIM68950.1 preprotein translocase subunit YajC [Corynebacterium breve]